MSHNQPKIVYLTFKVEVSGKLNLKKLAHFVVCGSAGTKDLSPTTANAERLIKEDCFFNVEPGDINYLPALSDLARLKLLKILEIGESDVRVLSDKKMVYAPRGEQVRRAQNRKSSAPVVSGAKQSALFW